VKKPGTWDMGLDYLVVKNKITRKLKSEDDPRRRAYLSILLIQLVNGARIGEAVRAYRKYCSSKNKTRKIYVDVEKRRHKVKRLMVIPENVYCYNEILSASDERLKDRVKHFSKNYLGINTHSLRYAFITYLLEKGINPSIIAKITQHARLDYILRYTQEKKAEEILLEQL
jgi:integrase